MNLTNTRETPPHRVFQELAELCAGSGLQILGSELVGMIPEALLRQAGEVLEPGASDSVGAGIRALRLGVLHEFDPERRIIERASQQVAACG